MTTAETYQRFRIFQAKLENKYTPQVQSIFVSQAKAFNAYAGVHGYPMAVSKIHDFFPAAPFIPVLNNLHFEAAGKYGSDVYKQFRNVKSSKQVSLHEHSIYFKSAIEIAALRAKHAIAPPSTKGIFNSISETIGRAIVSALRLSLLQNVHGITDSAKNAALDIIQEGAKEGWGYDKTAAKIESDIGGRYRAQRIVRTESVKASNMGAVEGAKATGLKMNKVWLTARDMRVRGNPLGKPSKFDHWDMQGQQVPLERPFFVGGEELNQPGDPNGSPGNIIQCRCVASFVPIRDANGRPVRERVKP